MAKRKNSIAGKPAQIRGKSDDAKNAQPERLTSQRICNLCAAANLKERTTTTILQKAGLNSPNRKGYEVIPALASIIAFYKDGYERRDTAAESDLARKRKSEADSAELDTMAKRGELCRLVDAKLYVSDFAIEVRQRIEADSNLSPTQKTRLLASMAGIKIEPPNADTD